MYRALTWWILARGVPVDDAHAIAEAAGEPIIEVGTDPDGPWVTVDGQDVSAAIRTQPVTSAVSAVARVPRVRAHLIAQQREIIAQARAQGRGIVAEGRDIGTVVAPDAVVKVYLTASEHARAQRRSAETPADPAAAPGAAEARAAGVRAAGVSADQVRMTQADQARRDRMDSGQLARADDAVEIDSTMFGLEDVIAMIVGLAQKRAGLPDTARTTR